MPKINITKRFIDEASGGSQLRAPGEIEVDEKTAARLVKAGRAHIIGREQKPGDVDRVPKPVVTPAGANPRIDAQSELGNQAPSEPGETPLPEDFPKRDQLIAAGFDTIEKLKGPDVREKLLAIEGLGEASVTKIGLAVS